MAGQVVIDHDTILKAVRSLDRAGASISISKNVSDNLQGACGDDHLEDRIHDFQDSWNYNRDKLVAFLENLRANLFTLKAEFEAFEARLETALAVAAAAAAKPAKVPPRTPPTRPGAGQRPGGSTSRPSGGRPPTRGGAPASGGAASAGPGEGHLVGTSPTQQQLRSDWEHLLADHRQQRAGFEDEAQTIARGHDRQLAQLRDDLATASPEERAAIADRMVAIERATQQELAGLQARAHALEQEFRRDARQIASHLDGMQWIPPEKPIPVPAMQPSGSTASAPLVPVLRPRAEAPINLVVGR